MTTLRADSKTAATQPREQRSARDEARITEERAAQLRARPVEAVEVESYNLPFTD